MRQFVAILAALLLGRVCLAQQDPPVPPTPPSKPGSPQVMDYGPVIAHTIHCPQPKKNIAYKGLAIRLTGGDGKPRGVAVYDTDLMRLAFVSLDGDIDLSKTNHTSYKGNGDARVTGTPLLSTQMAPGWGRPKDGSFADPRSFAAGPLPREWVRYEGFHRHGDAVVLKYRVGECEVLEVPRMVERDGHTVFVRDLSISASKSPLTLFACDWSERIHVALEGGPAGVKWHHGKDRIALAIPARDTTIRCRIVHAAVTADGKDVKPNELKDVELPDLAPLTCGGPQRWKDTLTTTGKLAADAKAAYVVDALPCPEKNPWHSWFRPTAFDFFADGTRAAIATWNGDVWIVSGIDDKLDKLSWKRFAAGLYEPLGLVVKDDQVYVLSYDQITRLNDLNGDGEADYYENFHNDWVTWPRCYPLCLSIDSKGDFYTLANGNRAESNVPLHGCVLRITGDGKKLDVFATGLRSANGLGIGPGDVLAVADQEGNWTPTSRIDLVRQGDYIGYKPHAHRQPVPEGYKKPLCWLPKPFDNSPGDLLWAPADPKKRWGPLAGQLLGMSYGMCKLYVVPYETVGVEQSRVEQGGVIALPLQFSSGIMRGRFNPRDGQLYLLGLKGWQTRAAFDSGFFRVRYTGEPAHLPVALRATKAGVAITFTDPLDRELAEDISSYQVLRWNYIYSEKYGSPEMSLANPAKQGRDAVTVKRATLSADGRTVQLELEDMKPAMQMMIKLNLESQRGDTVRHEVHLTAHETP